MLGLVGLVGGLVGWVGFGGLVGGLVGFGGLVGGLVGGLLGWFVGCWLWTDGGTVS